MGAWWLVGKIGGLVGVAGVGAERVARVPDGVALAVVVTAVGEELDRALPVLAVARRGPGAEAPARTEGQVAERDRVALVLVGRRGQPDGARIGRQPGRVVGRPLLDLPELGLEVGDDGGRPTGPGTAR